MRLVTVAAGWLAGLALASLWELPAPAWVMAAAASFLFAHRQQQSRWAQLGWLLAALALGGGRYTVNGSSSGPEHVAYYNDGRPVVLTGLVTAPPRIQDRGVTLRVQVESVARGEGVARPVEGVVEVTTFRFPIIPYGARLQVTGALEKTIGPDGRRTAPRDIAGRFFLPEVTVLATGEGARWRHTLLAGRDRAQQVVVRLLPDPAAALLNAILLGDDDGLPRDLKEAFRAAGLAHLTVVSGFHVAILVGVLQAITRPYLGRRGSLGVTVAGLVAYVLLVGAGPSVVRAGIMGGLYLVGNRGLGRATFTLGSLALAAIVMTAVTPLTLWDVGFQLSATATLGLILFAGRGQGWLARQLYRRLPSWLARPLMNAVGRPLIVSLAAQSLTWPLVAYYFESLSPAALPANVLVLPAQAPALLWGGAAALLGLVSVPLGRVVAWVAWLPLTYTVTLVRLLAALPGATLTFTLTLPMVVAAYIVMGGTAWWLTRPPARRRALLAAGRVDLAPRSAATLSVVAALLALSLSGGRADGRLHVTFLDIGQGDAIFIQSPTGRRILVDGGLYPTRLNAHLGRRLPYWVRELDIVIATHPDADHVSGLTGVFARYDVARLLTDGSPADAPTYEALLNAATVQGTAVSTPQAGDVILVEDGLRLEVVHPGPEGLADNRNDNSVSLRLVYGNFSLLLTGDAEETAEGRMLARPYPLASLTFKAGHHGSRTSSTAPFLVAVRPQIVVVSAGVDNRFGHPHPEVLTRVAAAGAVVLRTDELGSIEVISDGVTMWWQAR